MTNKQIYFYAGSSYDKGGQIGNVRQIKDIDVTTTKKENLTWLQVFNCNYRTTTENINWCNWNGCVFLDIDSKLYYNNVKQFNVEKLLDAIHSHLLFNFNNNFYNIQLSNSGTSFHIMFFFDVERNELNFRKCVNIAKDIVLNTFISIGAKEIITYKGVIDKCSVSPYQGMYLTNNQILWGSTNDNWFGWIDEEYFNNYTIEETFIKKSDIKDDGTKLFIYNELKQIENTVNYKPHNERMQIYTALIGVFNDYDEVTKQWEYIASLLPEHNGHDYKFYLNEPIKNKWYDRYNSVYVNVDRLKEFGYKFEKIFEPLNINLYDPDIVYELNENQHLSDINIDFKKDKINHIFAGCGFGKTYWAKQLSKQYKVCFISPLTSIIKDGFDTDDADNWLIVDNEHKDVIKHIYDGDIKYGIESHWSICTTWESFVLYEMYNVKFDYIIVDEIHTLYMYDYRVNSIVNLKECLLKSNAIKVFMTGTPSYEVKEFDCHKIQVNKEQQKVKTDVVVYNESWRGYVYDDIKEWTSDNSHYAILFIDTANYRNQEDMMFEKIDADVFNSNYKSTTSYILNNKNVKKQVTIFSVYGQAGINLWVDTDKKMRIYIMNDNGLGIVQYANRVRNKETIDKVVVMYKKSNVTNDIKAIDDFCDITEAKRKVDIINSTIKDFDIFSLKNKSIIKLKYGFTNECLDVHNRKLVLNEKNYECYNIIRNVGVYEKQLQVIYNRLQSNYFDVTVKYLQNDIKTTRSKRYRSTQLAGQLIKFDNEQIKTDRKNNIYFEPNNKMLKVLTGNLKENIQTLLNCIYIENFRDITKTKECFNYLITEIDAKKDNITKKDIDNLVLLYNIKSNWNQYYNNNFIVAMQFDGWDDCKLTAAYIRSIYNDTMLEQDWKSLADETYTKIHSIRDVFNNYADVIKSLPVECGDNDIQLDDITQKVYNYISSKHHTFEYEGKTYKSVKEAAKTLGISRQALYKRMKQQ